MSQTYWNKCTADSPEALHSAVLHARMKRLAGTVQKRDPLLSRLGIRGKQAPSARAGELRRSVHQLLSGS